MKSAIILALTLLGGAAAAQTQLDLNVSAYAKYQATDLLMNRSYRVLLAAATSPGRLKLLAAQRDWLAYRDSECAYETLGTVDGSIHQMIVAGCLESLTRAQTARLNAQLHCQEGDMSCGGQ